jgi:lysophospholipid acyltransferase (LPLAT)-like uncharacterized protein
MSELAAKYVRPTLMFTIIAALTMIVISVSINKIPKKERKGAGFGVIIMGLIVSIVSMMYNFWLYAKETGMANSAKAQAGALYSKMQTKTFGAPQVAGSTNVGAPPV